MYCSSHHLRDRAAHFLYKDCNCGYFTSVKDSGMEAISGSEVQDFLSKIHDILEKTVSK